jgi:acyl-CoA thioester hydrolase
LRTHTGVVYPAQCDAMGHLNVAHYVAAFDQAMWHLVHAFGYRGEWQQSRREGWADVRHDVTFSRELRVGSLYYIESAVTDLGGKSITTVHRMMNMDGETAAVDEIKSVYFDLERRRALPIPEEIRTGASSMIDTSVENERKSAF